MKMKLLSLVALVFVFSCKSQKDTSPANSDQLESGTYEIVSMDGERIIQNDLSLTLDLSENLLSGYTGCNNFSSDLELEGTNLDLGHARVTMRHCEDKAKMEQQLLRNLNQSKAYFYKDGELVLKSKDGKSLLTAKKMENKLKNGDYTIVRMAGESIEGQKVTLSINADEHQVSGSTGCNTYGSEFSQDGDQLEMNYARVTRMFCEGKMDIEGKFLKNLKKVASFSYQGDTLELKDADGSVLLVAEPQ